MQELKEAEALLNSWICERRNTVKRFRDLADEIQTQEEKSRAVTIAGTAVSVVGGYVAVVAGISAIFTGGATLPIAAAVGSTYASVGGLVVLGNEIVDKIVKSKATEQLDKAIVNDKKVSGCLWEALQRIEAKINSVEGSQVIFAKSKATELLDKAIVNDKKVSDCLWEALQRIEAKINSVEGSQVMFAKGIGGFGYNCYNLGKKVAESGDQAAVANNAFQALGDGWKVVHVVSIGSSSISLLLNVKTLAQTLVKVRKGEILKVVSDVREQAQKLEDEIPVYEKKVEILKRRVELLKRRDELLKRRDELLKRRDELLKRRVESQGYMAFFLCCIGIIIYFVYYRL